MPKKKTILIIEDENDIRNFACRVLELEGYRVLQAENGEEGLKLLRGEEVALVLLDLRLPGWNGWEVLEKIKQDPELAPIPVVVFTASAAVSQRERALTLGAANYLVKPLSAVELKRAVNKLLR
jgi:CheY-like chemotaxis protein